MQQLTNETFDIVLLVPPFYRMVGSHNDRVSIAMAYLSRILKNNNMSHIVYNADYTGSQKYWSMKRLFENYDYFIDAVDNKSSLYDEVTEHVLGLQPKFVVILGADPLIPTKDWGSPYIAANFSKRLREKGVFTIGLGPYFNLDTDKFLNDFDAILKGEPSETIIDIIDNKKKGVITSKSIPIDILPNFENLYPKTQKTDILMGSFGCLYPCTFCIAGQQYRSLKKPVRFVDMDILVKDIERRAEFKLYFEDLTFSYYKISQLELLAKELKTRNIEKEFVIESRCDGINMERLELYKKIGIRTIKLGVETMDKDVLKNVQKKQSIDMVLTATKQIKEMGMKCIIYILLGPYSKNDDFEKTKKLIKQIAPDYVVVSISAYDLETDYKYDTQFSPLKLKSWGVEPELFFDYLALQTEFNPSVGHIIS